MISIRVYEKRERDFFGQFESIRKHVQDRPKMNKTLKSWTKAKRGFKSGSDLCCSNIRKNKSMQQPYLSL